jgi:hypothetical protein
LLSVPCKKGTEHGRVNKMNGDVTAEEDLEEFLVHWYGPPKSPLVILEGAEPLSLRQWYACKVAWEQELARQNRALPAEELKLLDGKTVFYEEHNGAWLWGYGDDPNPEVFDRESDVNAQWAPTGERLDMFLWHMAVFEAALSGPYNLGANNLTLDEIERCTGLLDLYPFEPWRFPGPRSDLWSNDDLVVLTCANLPFGAEVTDESRWALFVGGRTREALDQLNGIGIAWDFDSRALKR